MAHQLPVGDSAHPETEIPDQPDTSSWIIQKKHSLHKIRITLDKPEIAMADWIRLVGTNQTLEILGVKLVGVNAENGKKLLMTIVLVVLALLLRRMFRGVITRMRRGDVRVKFWARQGVQLFLAVVLLLGLVSIWFDDPTRLTTALGLVMAGTVK